MRSTGSFSATVAILAVFGACGRSVRHEPNEGEPQATGGSSGYGGSSTSGKAGRGGAGASSGGKGGQGGTSRGGDGQGGTSRGGAGNSGGDAGETVGDAGTGGEPTTGGEGGDGGGGGVGPCPGDSRRCEGDNLHYCDGASERILNCRSFYELEVDPPLEATCLETNAGASCAVHVGEKCMTFTSVEPLVLPCVEENAACVRGADAATCVADIGSCTEGVECIGSFRAYSCNFGRAYGDDCRAADAGSTCRVDAQGRSYCADLPLGAPCNSNADGMMGPGNYPGYRCAPGLSCVLTGDGWRCAP